MVDDGIGAEIGRRPVGKAEADGDNGDAGRPCRGRVGDRIADEDGGRRVTAGGSDGGEDMARIGLGPVDRIEAEVGREARVPAQRRNQRTGQGNRLVGADGKACPGRCQRIERGLDPVERPRAIGNMGGIIVEEVRHAGFDDRGRHRAGGREAAFEQLPCAMPDHVAHVFRRDAGATKRRQRMVERRAQIGRGIDKRAVEIEDDGGGKRLHVASMRLHRFPRQGRYGRADDVTDAAPRPLAAVILAAGQGTRMKSARHKVLHPIAGKPMLLHLLDSLESLGPAQRVVVVGAGREQVEAAVAGREVAVAVQSPQYGTGHAVQQAESALQGFDGDVLVLFGDVPLVTAATMQRLLAALTDDVKVAVLGFRPADAAAYGRIIADGGRIRKMVEFKDASAAERAETLCNSGLLAVRAADLWPLLARVRNDNAAGEYYLPDIVGLALADGGVATVIETDADEVAGVNSRAELAGLEARFQSRRRAEMMAAGVTLIDPGSVFFAHDTQIDADVTIEPFVVFGPGVRIAGGATIRAHSHIEGAIIGPGCEVGPFARLRPGTVLEDGAKIGNFVETKKTTLGPGAKANHLTYLGDATIGAKANIGAGTITCNYDGFFKYQTHIGAGAFIGSNSALVAPVTIGEGAMVAAGSTITADVGADALAIVRPAQDEKPGWAKRFRAAAEARKKG